MRICTVTSLPILVVAMLCGCMSTQMPDEQVRATVAGAVVAARGHLGEGRHPEALMILHAARRVAPGDSEVVAALEQVPAGARNPGARALLGSNQRLRPPIGRSPAARVLLYPVDRVLDLTDLVSADLGFGLGLLANVHATRALQVGAGFSGKAGVGWHRHRSLGMQTETEAGIVLPAVGTQAFAGARAGTSGILTGSDGMAGLHRPSDDLYADYRDYWALGASATAVVIAVSADLHPVQVLDFLAGFVGLDPGRDDFATTRGLVFAPGDAALLRALSQIERQRRRR